MARITVSPRNSNAFSLHDILTTGLYRPCRMLRVAHHGHRCAHDVCAALSVGAHCLHSAVQHHHQTENNLVCSSSGIEVSIAAHRCAICWVDGRNWPIQPQWVAHVDVCSSQRSAKGIASEGERGSLCHLKASRYTCRPPDKGGAKGG